VICVQHQTAIYSLRSISEVFLKIYVNYLQIHGILLEGSLDLLDRMGMGSLKIISDMTVNSIDSFLSSKCLGDYIGLDPATTIVGLGLLTLPIMLSVSWLGFFIYACYVVRTRLGAYTKQRHMVTLLSDAMTATHSVAFGDDFKRPSEEATATTFNGGEDSDQVLRSKSAKSTFTARQSIKSRKGAYYRSQSGASIYYDDDSESSDDAAETVDMTSSYRDHSSTELHNLPDRMVVQRVMSHWVMFSHILLICLHVPVLRTLLSALTCRQYDVLRLEKDLDIICLGRNYTNWFTLTALGVAAHGVAVPLFILHRLCKIRNRLLQINVRRSYGFLYNGFEPHRYYYETISMIFKTVMLLALSIPDSTFRNYLQTCVVLTMQGTSVFLRPWDDRAYFMFDKLEAISQTALSASALASMTWYVTDVLPSSPATEWMGSKWLYLITFACCASLHVVFNLFFFQRFFRHTVTKYLVMLREYFPDSLTFKDHVLLAFFSGKLHQMSLENGHTLNIAHLCGEEKEFVKKALYTTLYWYMAAERKNKAFRLDCLGPAISEAFKRCLRSSRGTVRQILDKDPEYSRCGKFLSMFDDKSIHKRLLAVLEESVGLAALSRKSHGCQDTA